MNRLFSIIFVLLVLLTSSISAENLISYQGRLTTSGGSPVPNNTYPVTFSITSDFAGTVVVWYETTNITTNDGLFSHNIGSVMELPTSIFMENDSLYLKVEFNGETVSPPTKFTSVPSAITASHLKIVNDTGLILAQTKLDTGAVMQFFDTAGNELITFNSGTDGDSSVMLPEASVNHDEIADEPGIASRRNSSVIDLATGSMTDLVLLEISIPAPGYILLYGKCYLLLSGTTGANSAKIQIDDEEGGTAFFPYYTQAGLGGYVNTAVNYFPIFVTRVFYGDTAGSYIFRMEGKAENSLPAQAQTWDHMLIATYYPSSYGFVSTITTSPEKFINPIPISNDSIPERSGSFYEADLRELEKKKE